MKKITLKALVFLYLVFHVINLTLLPIFNDESIYLDWGYRMIRVPSSLFYSLFDAKPPLLMWVYGIGESFFTNPLFFGRLISVAFGLMTLTGIYLICKKYFDKKTAVIASVFYIFVPIFVLYNRQALMESAIATVGIWGLYLLLRLFETKNTSYSIVLGIILGAGVFIKLNAFVFLLTIVIVLLINKQFKISLLVIFISQLILLPLYSQEEFWATMPSNSRFSLTLGELLRFPIGIFINNLKGFFEIGFWQLTPLIFISSIVGIYIIFKNKADKQKVTAWYFLISLIMVIFTVKNVSPRYIISYLPIMVVFAAISLSRLNTKSLVIVLTIVLIFPVFLTFGLIFRPINYFNNLSHLTRFSQKYEYVTGWPSGYGVTETVDYINKKIADRHTFVGVRLDAGNPESAIFTYFYQSVNIKPIFLDQKVIAKDLTKTDCIKSNVPIYFVSRDNQLAGLERQAKEIMKFYKPEHQSYVGIYKINTCN